MDQFELENQLSTLPLGDIRYFEQIASTNVYASDWILSGCPDLALVVADSQTAGRGRNGRKWFTPANSALAFSLVLQTQDCLDWLLKVKNATRLSGLGALAVCQALKNSFALPAQIKWPNDILVNGKKLSGILTEAHWIGNKLAGVVLGIGINVATASVPPFDWDSLNPSPFPATCVESTFGRPVDRWNLLFEVLHELLTWKDKLLGSEFLYAWEENLAYRDQHVQVVSNVPESAVKIGKIVSLREDGALQIQVKSGPIIDIRAGEIHPSDPPLGGIHLRPVDRSKK